MTTALSALHTSTDIEAMCTDEHTSSLSANEIGGTPPRVAPHAGVPRQQAQIGRNWILEYFVMAYSRLNPAYALWAGVKLYYVYILYSGGGGGVRAYACSRAHARAYVRVCAYKGLCRSVAHGPWSSERELCPRINCGI
jgi:hypothetical protein